jgi:hypothetical protein
MTRPPLSAGSCLRPLRAALAELSLDHKSRLELWVDLLARLTLAAQACAEAEGLRHLRRCGVRQTHTVAKNLLIEYEQILMATQVFGHTVSEADVQPRLQHLSDRRCSLEQELQELAYAYLRLLGDAVGPDPASAFDGWLRERADIHLAQADAIRRGV